MLCGKHLSREPLGWPGHHDSDRVPLPLLGASDGAGYEGSLANPSLTSIWCQWLLFDEGQERRSEFYQSPPQKQAGNVTQAGPTALGTSDPAWRKREAPSNLHPQAGRQAGVPETYFPGLV